MTSAPLFIEVGHAQRRKAGQDICGDSFKTRKQEKGERIVAVLSDGLGSGVKANILASMTASMALKFVSGDMPMVHSAEVMMDALPECRVRKISYATFSIVDCRPHERTRLIEMDNPRFLLIRQGECLDIPSQEMASPKWKTRVMRLSEIETSPEDRLVLFSDGITQAGLGTGRLPLGWREKGCRDYVLEQVRKDPGVSARDLSRRILNAAVRLENQGKAHDDMTCAVFYFRRPRRLLLLTGPPYDASRDAEYARMASQFEGRKVLCGGTTANIVGRELGREIEIVLEGYTGDLPPISRIEGIDLVTEGILTLTRAARILEDGPGRFEENAATELAQLLRDSDHIEMVVGSRVNEAHQDPNHPLDIEIRRNIIKRIARTLEEKYLKEVQITCI